VARIPVARRFDLTDEQWAVLAPLLPVGCGRGWPPKWSKRQLIDGIRWRTWVGCPWRDVPACYGAWQTVYGLFRRWLRDGTWSGIVTGLEPGDHALGRSRGGFSTKLHLACEQGRKTLSWRVTAGQCGDSPQFAAVLDAIKVPRRGVGHPRTRPNRVLADKAYSSRANRDLLRRRGIRVTIPIPVD